MKTFYSCLGGLLVLSFSAQGDVLFYDHFEYANGNLAGQGAWTQTGSSSTSPIQVSSGRILLGTSGQDANAGLFSNLTLVDGTSFYIGLNINVSAAQTGDYFLHWTPNAGNSSAFYSRLFVQSSGAGYVLGYQETSGTGGAQNYGSTVLNFGADYRVVIAYNVVAGPVNDTASIYVNPTDLNVEGNNTPYLANDTWTTSTVETNLVGSINLRQGSSSSAPTLSLDNLVVSTLFSEAAPVPEPSTICLALLGGFLGLVALRRR